jgi:hypothetical protein
MRAGRYMVDVPSDSVATAPWQQTRWSLLRDSVIVALSELRPDTPATRSDAVMIGHVSALQLLPAGLPPNLQEGTFRVVVDEILKDSLGVVPGTAMEIPYAPRDAGRYRNLLNPPVAVGEDLLLFLTWTAPTSPRLSSGLYGVWHLRGDSAFVEVHASGVPGTRRVLERDATATVREFAAGGRGR